MDLPAETVTSADPPRRPGELAVLLLAIGTGPPRDRARDQQADRAGGDLLRAILQRVVALDPDPDPVALGEALSAVVTELGEPTGPTRAVAAMFQQDWATIAFAPESWNWFVREALERSSRGDDPTTDRRRRRSDRGAP